jgi:hypothetical protein
LQLVSPNFSENGEARAKKSLNKLYVNVKLLYVCKMVYEEALPILYKNINFFFVGNAGRFGDLDCIISGHARKLLACIRLDTNERMYRGQLECSHGPKGYYDNLWLEICSRCPGLKRVGLDFTNAGEWQSCRTWELIQLMITLAM